MRYGGFADVCGIRYNGFVDPCDIRYGGFADVCVIKYGEVAGWTSIDCWNGFAKYWIWGAVASDCAAAADWNARFWFRLLSLSKSRFCFIRLAFRPCYKDNKSVSWVINNLNYKSKYKKLTFNNCFLKYLIWIKKIIILRRVCIILGMPMMLLSRKIFCRWPADFRTCFSVAWRMFSSRCYRASISFSLRARRLWRSLFTFFIIGLLTIVNSAFRFFFILIARWTCGTYFLILSTAESLLEVVVTWSTTRPTMTAMFMRFVIFNSSTSIGFLRKMFAWKFFFFMTWFFILTTVTRVRCFSVMSKLRFFLFNLSK